MITWYQKNKKTIILISLISLIIPLLWVTYKAITSKKDSITVTFDWHPSLISFLVGYYILLLFFIFSSFIYWLVLHIKMIINLKNEKTKTELIHLKNQVSPHFFFNTLNNLYGLIDKDSEKAKHLILKISDMMRYSVYEGQKDTVLIKDEVDFIYNFIELHTMRYLKKLDISFTTEIKNTEIKITPLLFIILIENAFKHGVEILRNDAFIRIFLRADNSTIYFKVENNFNPTVKTEKGIGLENLTRRLTLIYPNKHTFITNINNDIFKAQLTIQL